MAENRKLVSHLGAKPTPFSLGLIDHPDFAESALVSESINLTPGKDGKMLPHLTQSYRHCETSTTFSISRSAEGFSKIGIATAGQVISATELDPKNPDRKLSTSIAYDVLGRRISTTLPRTGTSRTEYHPKTGRVVAEIDPENRRSTVEYYPAGQPFAGQVSAMLNPAGKAQRFAYNLRGQQVSIWGDTQYPIAYDYNEYGERTTLRTFQLTPNGQPGLKENEGSRTSWTYHEATGSLLKKSYADGTGPEYAYDKTGQLAERKWARKNSDIAAAR